MVPFLKEDAHADKQEMVGLEQEALLKDIPRTGQILFTELKKTGVLFSC